MHLENMVSLNKVMSELGELGGTGSDIYLGFEDGELSIAFTTLSKNGDKLGLAAGMTTEEMHTAKLPNELIRHKIKVCLDAIKATLCR